jgi:hypothetical protein
VKLPKQSAAASVEERKIDAMATLTQAIKTWSYIDLDVLAFSMPGGDAFGRNQRDVGQTPLIMVSLIWMRTYRCYCTELAHIYGSHPLFADRTRYITLMEARLETYTVSSVLDYDRNYRLDRVGQVSWCDTDISPFHRNRLVLRAPARLARISANAGNASGGSKDRNGRDKDRQKKLPEAKRASNGACHAAEKGQKCMRGSFCRFTHTHSACGKDHKHVWATCA